MICKNRVRLVGILTAAAMLFVLSSCMMDGPPKVHKTNGQPYGKYVCEAGTLTFMEEGNVAPSGEAGYVNAELASEYIYLLDGRENGIQYDFMWEHRDGDSERRYWYIYDFSESAGYGDEREIAFLDFIWDREGWQTGEDTVTIQGAEGGLIFKFTDDK